MPPPFFAYIGGISGQGECWDLKGNIEERACTLAAYIIENRTTVREAAKRFGISKSTVHTAVTKWNGPQGGGETQMRPQQNRGSFRAFPEKNLCFCSHPFC